MYCESFFLLEFVQASRLVPSSDLIQTSEQLKDTAGWLLVHNVYIASVDSVNGQWPYIATSRMKDGHSSLGSTNSSSAERMRICLESVLHHPSEEFRLQAVAILARDSFSTSASVAQPKSRIGTAAHQIVASRNIVGSEGI